MVHDAEAHAEEDKNRRELIDLRNQTDSLVYQTEKSLSENKDKIPAEDVSNLEAAITETKKALEGDEKETIERARDNLMQASHKLAEVLYKQTAESAQAADGADGAGPTDGAGPEREEEGEVVDAEFEDTDKK